MLPFYVTTTKREFFLAVIPYFFSDSKELYVASNDNNKVNRNFIFDIACSSVENQVTTPTCLMLRLQPCLSPKRDLQ